MQDLLKSTHIATTN